MWRGYRAADGYGKVWFEGKSERAHRVVYALLTMRVLQRSEHLDHLCKQHSCVNPDHLEVVSAKENWRRGDSVAALTRRTGRCQRGHVYNFANRQCMECKRANDRARR